MKPWMTGLMLLLLTGAAAAADDDLIAESQENLKWILDRQARSAAVSKIDDATPELVFDFQAAKRGPLELTVRTDSDRVALRLGRRGPRLDLNAGEANTLIVWVGPEPYVEVNGERDEDWAEDIADAVEREEPATVSLHFSRADGVLLKWRQLPAPLTRNAPEPIDERGDATTTIDHDGDGDAPAARSVNRELLLNRSRRGIVDLRIDRGSEGVFSIVSSPVLTDRHLVVVPASQLVGAQSVSVRLQDVDKTIDAKLVNVDLNVGLALLELDTTFVPAARAALRPIPIADQLPPPGEQVWLIGRGPSGPGLEALPVHERVSHGELDRGLRNAIRQSPLTQWLQTEGGITTNQSGSPVLDNAGDLVGIAAWAWVDRSDHGAILAATHLKSLIESTPPSEPMTLETLSEAAATMELPRMTFDRIETVQDQPAEQLRRLTAVLRLTGECPACDGSGVKLERKRVGYEQFGTMRQAIHHNVYDHCAICEGSGLKDAETFRRALDQVVLAAARLNGASDAATATLTNTGETLRELALNNLQVVSELVNAEAKRMIHTGPGAVGKPIVLVGELFDEVVLPGETRPMIGVKVEGERRGESTKGLVDQARHVDRTDAPAAMVAGVLSGLIQADADEPPVAIISHGLVIPLDPAQAVRRETVEQLNEELEAEREQRRARIEEERQRRERAREREQRERDRRIRGY